jgi:hypothetical protein
MGEGVQGRKELLPTVFESEHATNTPGAKFLEKTIDPWMTIEQLKNASKAFVTPLLRISLLPHTNQQRAPVKLREARGTP